MSIDFLKPIYISCSSINPRNISETYIIYIYNYIILYIYIIISYHIIYISILMYIYIIHTYLSIYICIYYPQKIFTWPWWPDSTSIWGAMDQLDGWLHGPAGWLRSEDPGGWHRHRLHRGLCQGCGGEGERVVCDVVMGQQRRNIGEKMGRKSENMGRSGKNMWRNSEKDGSRGMYL